MHKLMLIAAFAAAALTGCRSVEVANHGQDYVRDKDGNPILVDGKPVIFGKGWSVDHNQHWMITKADTINAAIKGNEITFNMNGLNTQPDSDGIGKVIDNTLKGAAELAAKIGAAVATSGGSAGTDAIYGYVKQFIAEGGDPAKATVTVTDGNLTCTDGSCTVSTPCPGGNCSE